MVPTEVKNLKLAPPRLCFWLAECIETLMLFFHEPRFFSVMCTSAIKTALKFCCLLVLTGFFEYVFKLSINRTIHSRLGIGEIDFQLKFSCLYCLWVCIVVCGFKVKPSVQGPGTLKAAFCPLAQLGVYPC